MPVLYKSEDIAIGKQIELFVGSNKKSYTVCGFFNSLMAGSHNCSITEMILTDDQYRKLEEEGYAPKAVLCSVRIKDKAESEDYESMLKNEVSLRYPDLRMESNSYTLVFQSRYISQMICSGIISAMAFFILLIALVVIASNIINYIGENMRNLGALKAIGYRPEGGPHPAGAPRRHGGGGAFILPVSIFESDDDLTDRHTLPSPFFAAAVFCKPRDPGGRGVSDGSIGCLEN